MLPTLYKAELGAEQWFEQLRQSFVAVARRRVPLAAVDDVVQDALRVVHEKNIEPLVDRRVDERPTLAWCFQVLRNIIGNHYQRERRRGVVGELDVDNTHSSSTPTPLEALESSEVARLVNRALDNLARADASCGHYLRRMLTGASPAALAKEEDVPAAALYRRVYRCRQKLRALLETEGVTP